MVLIIVCIFLKPYTIGTHYLKNNLSMLFTFKQLAKLRQLTVAILLLILGFALIAQLVDKSIVIEDSNRVIVSQLEESGNDGDSLLDALDLNLILFTYSFDFHPPIKTNTSAHQRLTNVCFHARYLIQPRSPPQA
jgi:hypothetical protein